jgi:putative DNA primase/helicase
MRSWRSTASALEASASVHSDTILVLDELGVVDAKAAACVYQLVNGQVQHRLAI